jgi:hypothetical protein
MAEHHNQTDEHKHMDEALDEALRETFPASDPPAETVQTGTGSLPVSIAQEIVLEVTVEVDPPTGTHRSS